MNMTQKEFLERVANGSIALVDLKEKYALHQTTIAMANGIAFNASKDENIQNWYDEFADSQEINNKIWNLAYHAKLEGAMFASLAETDDGQFTIDVAYPQYNNKVAKVYDNKKLAILYKRPVNDDTGIIIKEVWDTMKVVREASYKGDKVSLDGLIDERGNQIKEVWNHNLGILPVFVYHNKPKKIFHLGADHKNLYKQLAMDYAVRYLADEYNFTARMGIMAEVLLVPRMNANLSPSSIEKLKKGGGALGVFLNQLYLKSSKVDTAGKTNSGVEIIQGQNESQLRDEHLDSIEMRYAKGCGSTFSPDTTNVSTATEIFYSNSADERTANQDINNIETFMYEVFDALLLAKGLVSEIDKKERPYVFKVIGSKVLSDVDKTDNAIKKLQAGLITLEQALVEINNYSQEEAETDAEEIRKAKEKEQEDAMALMGEFDKGQEEQPQPNKPNGDE